MKISPFRKSFGSKFLVLLSFCTIVLYSCGIGGTKSIKHHKKKNTENYFGNLSSKQLKPFKMIGLATLGLGTVATLSNYYSDRVPDPAFEAPRSLASVSSMGDIYQSHLKDVVPEFQSYHHHLPSCKYQEFDGYHRCINPDYMNGAFYPNTIENHRKSQRSLLQSPTGSPTPSPTLYCTHPINVYINVDASGSIGASNFEMEKNWLTHMVDKMDIDLTRNYTRIGINEFGTTSTEYLKLGYYDKSTIDNVILNNLAYNKDSYTNTPLALNDTLLAFEPYAGEKNIMVMITDGFPCMPNGNCPIYVCDDLGSLPYDYGNILYDEGIRVVIVEVGPIELFSMVDCLVEDVTRRNTDIIRVESYNATLLQGIVETVVGEICIYPTHNPTVTPTRYPTNYPTDSPSKHPTKSPTHDPTVSPSKYPTGTPTITPTDSPSKTPTLSPSKYPTETPTKSPTRHPSYTPTASPSNAPSDTPTGIPTNSPTNGPTNSPTGAPTKAPTPSPTNIPSDSPTDAPTGSPTYGPTIACDAPANVLIALDTTGYLLNLDFNNVKSYVKSIASDIDYNNMEVGLVEVCNNVTTILQMGYREKDTVLAAIDGMQRCTGERNTAVLVDQAVNTHFDRHYQQRNTLLFFNNGLQCGDGTCNFDLCDLKQEVVDSSIKPVTFGLGTTFNYDPFSCLYESQHYGTLSYLTSTLLTFKDDILGCLCLSLSPTDAPTSAPSKSPTKYPTYNPTVTPSKYPTHDPTKYPTQEPTTKYPTISPSGLPTESPTKNPTEHPTVNPTLSPTVFPTKYPTINPTISPSKSPTQLPTTGCTQKLNVVYAHDESGSVGSANYAKGLEWFTGIVSKNNELYTRTGIIEFSDSASISLPLGYYNRTYLVDFVDNQMSFLGGQTNTPDAIMVAEDMFTPYLNTTDLNVFVLITDGIPYFHGALDVCPYNHILYDKGIRVVIIEIGDGAQDSQVDCLALGTDDIIISNSYNLEDLNTITGQVMNRQCQTLPPSPAPTNAPTGTPTDSPTFSPTKTPTGAPTSAPTGSPTISPTRVPTPSPTDSPTILPTGAPTFSPTIAPTGSPTSGPSDSPTNGPTNSPTDGPSDSPTFAPTLSPVTPICHTNLIFGIDTSGSICEENFPLLESMMTKLVNRIDTNHTRTAVYEFSDQANEVISLGYHSRPVIHGFLNTDLQYVGNFTSTYSFIENARDDFAAYNTENNVIVLLTDGIPCTRTICPQNVCPLKSDLDVVNARTKIIEFGPREQYSLIECLLKTPLDMMEVYEDATDSQLNIIADAIMDDLCGTVSPSLSPTESPAIGGGGDDKSHHLSKMQEMENDVDKGIRSYAFSITFFVLFIVTASLLICACLYYGWCRGYQFMQKRSVPSGTAYHTTQIQMSEQEMEDSSDRSETIL